MRLIGRRGIEVWGWGCGKGMGFVREKGRKSSSDSGGGGGYAILELGRVRGRKMGMNHETYSIV